MTTWEFPCSQPASISIRDWASGSVGISGEATDTIAVEVSASGLRAGNAGDLIDQVRVSFEDGTLTVVGPKHSSFLRRQSLDLSIKAPAGSDGNVSTASADVACVGQLGEVSLHTASGDLTLKSASGPVSAHTASGDVFVDRADDAVRIATTSGDVQVGRAGGEVQVNTASGDVSLGDCSGVVSVRAVSGDIDIRQIGAGQADISTVSGDVGVWVAQGMGIYLDLSSTTGDVRSELDAADGDEAGEGAPDVTLELKVRTISGDIKIARGRPQAA
jgi:DUF4097 and DUF4098 domain-containing protein YvlB